MQYDYTTILAALQDWPEDDDADYVLALPSLIALGEQHLGRDLGLGALDVTTTAAITSGDPLVTKPATVAVAYEMWYTNGGATVQLARMQPGFVRNYNATAANGNSRYFCEESITTWRLAPPPGFSGTLNMRHIAVPTGLSSGSPTVKTFFSTFCGDLLFFYCLLKGEQYLKDDRRWGMVKTNIDLLLPEAKAELAQLRRVTPEDQLLQRMIIRPENADATPQN